MNDFTKEELSILDDCMIIAIDEYDVDDRILEVKTKLQSLIDNYCEHKESEMDATGGISMVCVECGYTTMDI